MSTVNEAIATKSTTLVTSRLKNQVELYKGVDDKGEVFYFVLVKVGKAAFYMDIDSFTDLAYEFGDITSKMRA